VSRLVVKVGGASASGAAAQILALAAAGHEVCVVHGAGPQITAEMARRGIAVEFVAGRRVTTLAGLEVVRESFDAVNAALCSAIGPAALGLRGDEIGLVAEPVPALGLVGDARPSRPAAIETALLEGLIPVVTPLARGPLNVNADEAAAALALGFGAERIVFVTDVPGVFEDGALVRTISAERAERMIAVGAFEGGIVPKLLAAARAARSGVGATIGETAVVA
jgi:acetylglutamate kinase